MSDGPRASRRLQSVLAGHREVTKAVPENTQAPPSTPSAQPPLFRWGSLEVYEKLGEGTFGEVYRAWDPGVGREVALKLRKPGASTRSGRRWLDEARRLARVRHPNVLVVYGADEYDGRAGIWTELLIRPPVRQPGLNRRQRFHYSVCPSGAGWSILAPVWPRPVS